MTGITILQWVDGSISLTVNVADIIYAEPGSTDPTNYEYPTHPGRFPIVKSEKGSTHRIKIDTPYETRIRFHGGHKRQGCYNHGGTDEGERMEEYINKYLDRGVKMFSISNVTDIRFPMEKFQRPIPYMITLPGYGYLW